MKPKANYKKKVFGLLTVMQCVEESNGHNKGGLWLCKCKCRRTITLGGYQLHSRKSCGCLGRKAAIERGIGNKKTDEEKSATLGYRKYRIGNPAPVSKERWIIMIDNPCHYCHSKSNTIETELIENGKKDITICNICKSMKGKLNHQEFSEQIARISEYNQLSQ